MPRITLTRQVTGSDQVTLAPGEHEVPEYEAHLYRQMGWTDQAPVVDQPAPAPAPAPVLVEIPADWESIHNLQQVRLASEIAGRKVTTKREAGEVIRAEIARRNG